VYFPSQKRFHPHFTELIGNAQDRVHSLAQLPYSS